MASQKLQFLSKLDPSKAVEVVAKRRGAGGAAPAASAPAASAAAPKDAQAAKIFAALEKRIAENPGLKQEVRATVTFVIDGATKTFELGGTAAATLTATDDDFVSLVTGKATAKNLFQHGKLRVDGDVTVAHRLGFLKGLI